MVHAVTSNAFLERTLHAVFDALSPLRQVLEDESVTEIQINGPHEAFARRRGVDVRVDAVLSAHQIATAIGLIAAVNDKELGVRRQQYVLSAKLPGFRVEAMLPPVAIKGPSMCLRRQAQRVFTLDDYVAQGAVSAHQSRVLQRLMAARQNFLVAGSTDSGKTTLVNALLALIPRDQRLFVIEQVHELRVETPNCVFLECDPDQGVTAQRGLRVGMRYSPHRIVVGELRGGEALDFLNACNTGHPGSGSTLHADSAEDALARLEDLVMQAATLPYEAVQQRIGRALQWIVFIAQHTHGHRRVEQILRLDGFDRVSRRYHFTDFTHEEPPHEHSASPDPLTDPLPDDLAPDRARRWPELDMRLVG